MPSIGVLCAQLTRDLLATAKFLFYTEIENVVGDVVQYCWVGVRRSRLRSLVYNSASWRNAVLDTGCGQRFLAHVQLRLVYGRWLVVQRMFSLDAEHCQPGVVVLETTAGSLLDGEMSHDGEATVTHWLTSATAVPHASIKHWSRARQYDFSCCTCTTFVVKT